MKPKHKDKRVAVLAPASASGVEGGAEKFYAGLTEAIGRFTREAKLIAMPTDESSFESITRAYVEWQNLDLSDFDVVISTKAPTFAVKHPNHVLYLVHTIRVFYDMFNGAFPNVTSELLAQRDKIQEIDTASMAAIPVRFSIGEEVSERLQKYNDLVSTPLHPPLLLDHFKEGVAEDFFFMPGRLHAWKRVDLAILAIKASDAGFRLLIAGEGEAESDLRELAGDDKRIEFLGRISDQELVNLYSRSIAVIFTPLREDYGYITLEAFKSGKPVITCADSGEPARLVQSEKSGYVVKPEPDHLAKAMLSLAEDRELASTMGDFGKQSIAHIQWDRVAETLLDAALSELKPEENSKTKVAILDMQPIEPAIGGGRLRLLGLYHALGNDIEARYVGSYDWPGESYRKLQLTPTLNEETIPLSEDHHKESAALSAKCGGKVVIDLAFSMQASLSPKYVSKALEATQWADVVVFSHPWVYPLVEKSLRDDHIVVYDSQNVEGYLRAQLLDRHNRAQRDLLREVIENENRCGRRSDLVLACSLEDQLMFSRVYDWPEGKIRIVPNGVMAFSDKTSRSTPKESNRKTAGVKTQDSFHVFFIGSNYGPNIEAADFICQKLAPQLPDVVFIIAGGVGDCLPTTPPDNVIVSGIIDDEAREALLQMADIAVNPMFSGSGTNIKMFDMMGAALPVVTTGKGARGIASPQRNGFKIVEESTESFIDAITELRDDEPLRVQMAALGRECIESHYAWENISPALGQLLKSQLQHSKQSLKVEKTRHVGIFSTWNVKCGIAEESLRYADGLVAQGHRVTIFGNMLRHSFCNSISQEMQFPLQRVWFWDNQHYRESCVDLTRLQASLQASDIDTLLIQHHDAYLSDAAYQDVIALSNSLGLRTIVELHNASLVIGRASKLLHENVDFIVHSELDRANLVKIGIRDQITTIPLPIRQYPNSNMPERSDTTRPIIIAGHGFLRPYKGIKEAIACVAKLREKYPGTVYRGLHASYGQESQQFLEECRQYAQDLGVLEAVEFNTGYLTEETIQRGLASADVVLMPYHPSEEGGSAAISFALAARTPLVISTSNIFSEIRHLCYVASDLRPETLAKACSDFFDISGGQDIMREQRQAWVEQHSIEKNVKNLLRIGV